MSARLKLTLSYAGFLMVAGVLLLATVWLFLLRYVPDRALLIRADHPAGAVFPVRSNLLHVFAPRAAAVLAFLLVFGLAGGWLLLAPVAVGYQDFGADWTAATTNDILVGAALVLVSLGLLAAQITATVRARLAVAR